jgi:hypothetical protein
MYKAPYTPRQFVIFRVVFSIYLCWHFFVLLPWAPELFSNQGMLADVSLSPLFGWFPNWLAVWDHPDHIMYFTYTAIIISFLMGLGYARRFCALVLWYMWTCLFHRNVLILNPSLAYVGWLLLACAIIPGGESWYGDCSRRWYMPKTVYWGAWFLVAMSYTISGLHKLQCVSWRDGSALYHVLSTPLARDNWLTHGLLDLHPVVLQVMTYVSLILEITFLPLGIFARTRALYWTMFCMFHVGILFTVNFADLTLGVCLIHWFIFDHRWMDNWDIKNE